MAAPDKLMNPVDATAKAVKFIVAPGHHICSAEIAGAAHGGTIWSGPFRYRALKTRDLTGFNANFRAMVMVLPQKRLPVLIRNLSALLVDKFQSALNNPKDDSRFASKRGRRVG